MSEQSDRQPESRDRERTAGETFDAIMTGLMAGFAMALMSNFAMMFGIVAIGAVVASMLLKNLGDNGRRRHLQSAHEKTGLVMTSAGTISLAIKVAEVLLR